jgi:hypothetical protein
MTKPSFANLPSSTTLPSLAKMPHSSATLPSWAKLLPWENLPSSAKSPSSANSPLGEVVRTCLLWKSCHWGHRQHPAGIDAGIALSSSWTLPWCHCHHCCRGAGIIADVALAVSWPPLHGRQRPPLGCPLFQVDLLGCLGFGSCPNGRAAHLRSQRRPSLGLCLLGQPLGALDTQQGRLLVVIQNVARSLLLPVIPVPSGLVQLSGHHHPGKSDAGTGVRLQCTSTFVTERMEPAPRSLISHRILHCVMATTTTTRL